MITQTTGNSSVFEEKFTDETVTQDSALWVGGGGYFPHTLRIKAKMVLRIILIIIISTQYELM
jgi:hypothetical protein